MPMYMSVQIMLTSHSNTATFVQNNKLHEAFKQASQGLGYAPDSSSLKQIKLSRDSTCTLQGLYPPKHYPKAEAGMGAEWNDAANSTCTSFDAVIQNSTMRCKPEDIINTDGSRKELTTKGFVTGSQEYLEKHKQHCRAGPLRFLRVTAASTF